MRIYLVDDEILALEDLARLVDWEALGHRVVGVSADPEAALTALFRERVDLLICDIRMPRLDGIELSRRLKEKKPDLMVVLLTGYRDFDYAWRAIGIHAEAYLLKDELTEESLTNILAQCGQRYALSQKEGAFLRERALREILLGGAFTKHRPPLGILSLGLLARDEEIRLFPRDEEWRGAGALEFSALREAGAQYGALFMPAGTGVFAAVWDTTGRRDEAFWDTCAGMLESGGALAGRLLFRVPPITSADFAERCYHQCLWASDNRVFFQARGQIVFLDAPFPAQFPRQPEEIDSEALWAALRTESE